MKRFMLTLLFACMLFFSYAQEATHPKEKIYFTSGGEIIFSLANISINNAEQSPILRFSPFFNLQGYAHKDMSEHFGLLAGMTLRNIGVIYDLPGTAIRKKARTYNVGIPIGIKIGDMNGTFGYVGYEVELAYNYKEKTFESGDKTSKSSYWFTDRVNMFQHGFFAGVQFPFRANIKFKYYLSKLYNQDYVLTDSNGSTSKPYAGIDVNIFYFSLSYSLLKDDQFMRSSKTYSARR